VTTLRISPAAHAVIQAHLCRAYPEEGCGVLIGREGDGVREIEVAIGFDNAREDSRGNRYLLSPEQVLAGERSAREMSLDVMGFFHSHPDHPARPSAFDLEHAWPYYSYVIASVEGGRLTDLRSWRLTEERTRFESESLDLPAATGMAGADATPE